MTTIAGETTLLETLESTLTSAVGRTRRTATEQLVCITLPAPVFDPVAMFEAAETLGNRALWDQPAGQFSIVAAGAAKEVTASGADRIQQLTAAWRELVADAVTDSVDESPLAAPIALSGMAYQPADGRTGAWQSYPDALFTVPRFLFLISEHSAWLTVSIVVGPNDDGRIALRSTLDDLSALLMRADRPMSDQSPPVMTVTAEDDSTQWIESVRAVEQEIRLGRVEKLVLAREVRARAEGPLAWGAALRRLKERYWAGTTFAFARDHSCFIGSSPERLVRLEGRTVQANCVAGSARRGNTEHEDRLLGQDLLHDDKELHEHALVVDAYRSALEPCCAALDIPDQPGLLTMPNVQHLHTPVAGTLRDDANDAHVLDLIARLHPTPAVGGVPQEQVNALIQAYESFDRGWYAGPVGWFDSRGDGEFVVAIRSALLQGQDALLYAGCGIVKGSDPEREYSESQLKLEPMLWALNGMDG